MKKILSAIIICLCVNSFIAQTVYKNEVDGEIYVKFTKAALKTVNNENPNNIPISKLVFITKILEKYGVTKAYKPFYQANDDAKLPYILKFEFSKIAKVDFFIDELSKVPGIEYAEKVSLNTIEVTPNDPTIGSQLTQINAQNAWTIFNSTANGNSNITVAIVDNAVDISHPDLTANIYTNAFEIAGNLIDDDGNGYIDDVNGWDAAENDNNPIPTNNAMDHGTHCAGIAGAITDNNVGIASIGWNIKIIPVKCTPDLTTPGTIPAAYQGVIYAAKLKARVISCSWGGVGPASISEQSVMDYAWNKGCIVIAAAGNNNSSASFYPAAYNHVYSVASLNGSDVKSGFSNYGTYVDIASPGENIYSLLPANGYGNKSGTSMACPLVAGLAGLMLSKSPIMSQTDVLNCISSSAANIYTISGNAGYVSGNQLGAGRIDAFAAMNCAAAFSTITYTPIANFFTLTRNICPNVPVSFIDSSLYSPTNFTWTFQGGTPATSTSSNPSVQWASPGTYSVSLTAANSNGSNTKIKTAYINVAGPIALPLNEGFQGATFLPTNWNYFNGDDNVNYWLLQTGIGGFGTSTNCALYDNFNLPTINRDEMRTPKYSFNNVVNAQLQFDVAYAEFDTLHSDSLEVKLSNDCGVNWTGIYMKGGATLASVVGPFTNSVFVPTATDWRTDVINISPLIAGQGNIMFSFVNHGHYGQALYLDNINIVVPSPTVNFNSPGTICAGSNLNIVNTSIGAASYSWTMIGSTTPTSNLANPVPFYPTSGIYSVTLLCSNGSSTASITNTISVVNNPATITINSPTICAGNTATLFANGASTFTWNTGATTSTLAITPSVTTVYSVTGSIATCLLNKTTTVVVTPNPTLSIANQSICPGQTGTITASGATTYSWSTGFVGNPLIISPSVTTTYSATGSTSIGCSDSKTVSVNVGIPISLGISANPSSKCASGSATLIASGANSYTWSPGGATTSSIIVNPASTTNYSLVGSTPSVCDGYTTTSVIVIPTPSFAITSLPSSTICAGNTVTLSASGFYSNYTWVTPTVVATSVTVAPSTSTTYTVFATGNGGCNTSSIVTVNVSIPQVSLILANSNCTNSCSGIANATVSSGTPPYVFSLAGGNCNSLPCMNLCAGNYTLVTNDALGCYSFNAFAINTPTNNLVASITSTNSSCSTCSTGIANISVSNGVGPYTYTWMPSVGNNSIVTNLLPGCYTVTATDVNGCSVSTSTCIGFSTGLQSWNNLNPTILIYPNPAENFVIIDAQNSQFNYALYSNLGQLIISKNNNQNNAFVNLSDLAKGIYLLEVEIGKEKLRKKLIIE